MSKTLYSPVSDSKSTT